jgi:hypothetical protein
MEHNPNAQFMKARLKILNLNNFKMIEAMRLEITASWSPWNGITSIPNFMKIYQSVQTLLVGDTQTDIHRKTDRLVI